MMSPSAIRGRAGVTLVEVIVATAVLVLVTVVILSSIVGSLTLVNRSVRNEPSAASAEKMVDTLTSALGDGITDTIELENLVGASYVANGAFSPELPTSRQFYFTTVSEAGEDVGYAVYVNVYNSQGEPIALRAYGRMAPVQP